MMFYLTHNNHDDLVVIRVSSAVLDLPDTVLTDGNAASAGTRFYPSPDGLANLNSALVFARYWTDDDYWQYQEKKRARNAEVLVPTLIPSTYIEGCYVDTLAKRVQCRGFDNLPAVTVRRGIFFR
jgi:ssDNA thymidine ADP-ribosyltransferase, DarT